MIKFLAATPWQRLFGASLFFLAMAVGIGDAILTTHPNADTLGRVVQIVLSTALGGGGGVLVLMVGRKKSI